jgi:hypothetical protein
LDPDCAFDFRDQFAKGKQPGVGCRGRTAKSEGQPAVEIEPQRIRSIHPPGSPSHQLPNQLNMLIIIAEPPTMHLKLLHHPANAGWSTIPHSI